MKTKIFTLLSVTLLFVGCMGNDVFFHFSEIPAAGWSQDSAYVFPVQVTDTTARYNVYVNVRNRGEYPYQNLWFFLARTTPDKVQTRDSVECYLADQRGKWLGKGIGSVYEISVLYQQNVSFSRSGVYYYKIGHGMRDSILAGINDIGMRVEKIK